MQGICLLLCMYVTADPISKSKQEYGRRRMIRLREQELEVEKVIVVKSNS